VLQQRLVLVLVLVLMLLLLVVQLLLLYIVAQPRAAHLLQICQ
jgi:hypothetical protein